MKYPFLLLAAFIFFFSCTRAVYVPQKETRTEYKEGIVRDSVFSRDSVFVLQKEKGDTIYLFIDKYHYLYRDKYVYDTTYVYDSIPYPVVVKEIKEVRHVPGFFRGCFVVALCAAGLTLIKLWRTLRAKLL